MICVLNITCCSLCWSVFCSKQIICFFQNLHFQTGSFPQLPSTNPLFQSESTSCVPHSFECWYRFGKFGLIWSFWEQKNLKNQNSILTAWSCALRNAQSCLGLIWTPIDLIDLCDQFLKASWSEAALDVRMSSSSTFDCVSKLIISCSDILIALFRQAFVFTFSYTPFLSWPTRLSSGRLSSDHFWGRWRFSRSKTLHQISSPPPPWPLAIFQLPPNCLSIWSAGLLSLCLPVCLPVCCSFNCQSVGRVAVIFKIGIFWQPILFTIKPHRILAERGYFSLPWGSFKKFFFHSFLKVNLSSAHTHTHTHTICPGFDNTFHFLNKVEPILGLGRHSFTPSLHLLLMSRFFVCQEEVEVC